MASSNPFRKSTVQTEEARFPTLDPIDTTQTHTAPPRTSFREAESTESKGSEAETKGSKPVKKVRVLTPPPLSPDSPEWPANVPNSQPSDQEDEPDGKGPDPFDGSATDESDREGGAATTPPPPLKSSESGAREAGSGPPGNPFSKTLQDLEIPDELEAQRREEGDALKAANSDRQTLNVDAFRRLLMTGDSGVNSSQASSDTGGPTAQTWTPLDAPQTQEYTATPEARGSSSTSQANKDKKIPPRPPSSRHGKTIKAENNANTSTEETAQTTESHTGEVTNPLPEAPVRGSLDADSPFDNETMGRASEQSTQDTAAGASRKPAPAPPPRRGHGRSDTKTNAHSQPTTGQSSSSKPTDDDLSARSSIDSTNARPDLSRHNAPAPPPPRRPHGSTKQTVPTPSSTATEPSGTQARSTSDSTESTQSNEASTSLPAKHAKSAAPPLPPARNSNSGRRPQSLYGAENAGRRTSGEGKQKDSMPPPPPPRRQTGNAQGPGSRKMSNEAEEGAVPGKGADILADLDALQREVDALRGQMK